MIVYELEKQATPGPLVYHCHTKGQGLQPRSGCAPVGRAWYWHRDDTGGSDPYKEKEANQQCQADMLFDMHCRNNFMRAVEALKRANSILEDEYPATDCRHPRQWRLDKLIAELEEVKT